MLTTLGEVWCCLLAFARNVLAASFCHRSRSEWGGFSASQWPTNVFTITFRNLKTMPTPGTRDATHGYVHNFPRNLSP
jgi:hypothetical protein